MSHVLETWGKEGHLSLYLEDGISASDMMSLRDRVRDYLGSDYVQFVSKEQAAEDFQKEFGKSSPLWLELVEIDNPLPASFEIDINSLLKTKDIDVDRAISTLASYAGVSEASYGTEWIKNYSSLISISKISYTLLASLLIIGSLFILANMVRSSIAQRRSEIDVLLLVGGTKTFVRMPYIFEAGIMSFISVSIALIGAFLFYVTQYRFIGDKLNFWLMGTQLKFLSFSEIGLVLALSIAFGCVAAYACLINIETGRKEA